MPFNLPNSVQALITGDSAATRSLTSIKGAVDPLLQLVGSCFEVLADGTLRIKRAVKGLTASDAVLKGLTALDRVSANRIDVANLITYAQAQLTAGFFATGISYVKGALIIQKTDAGTQGSLLVQGNASVQGVLNTATGIKTVLGQFGVSGNTTAGAYYNLGAAYYNQNVSFRMPFDGSLVGASIMLYTGTATTISTFYTGLSPTEYKRDTVCAANTYVVDGFSLARGAYTFTAGSSMVFKAYTPIAASGVSVCVMPIVEWAT